MSLLLGVHDAREVEEYFFLASVSIDDFSPISDVEKACRKRMPVNAWNDIVMCRYMAKYTLFMHVCTGCEKMMAICTGSDRGGGGARRS
jgi:hypothetical protein